MEFIDSSKDAYIIRIALQAELQAELQQSKQLPSDVTAEDITELLLKRSKKTQLWVYRWKRFDEIYVKNFLIKEEEVNTSLKMRAIELEARTLPCSPETKPAWFKDPIIINQAERHTRGLKDKLQETTGSKFVGLQGVVMEVVKKVQQGFLLALQCTSFIMPSQQLRNNQTQNHTEADSPVAPALSSPVTPPAIIAVQDGPTSSQTEPALLSSPRRNPHSLFAPLVSIIIDPNSCAVCNAPAGPATTVTSAQILPVKSPDDEAPPLSCNEPVQLPQLSSETDKTVIPTLILLSEYASVLHGDDVCDILSKDPVVVSAPSAHHTIFDGAPVITKQDVLVAIQNESKTNIRFGLYDCFNGLFCCCVPPEDDYPYF